MSLRKRLQEIIGSPIQTEWAMTVVREWLQQKLKKEQGLACLDDDDNVNDILVSVKDLLGELDAK